MREDDTCFVHDLTSTLNQALTMDSHGCSLSIDRVNISDSLIMSYNVKIQYDKAESGQHILWKNRLLFNCNISEVLFVKNPEIDPRWIPVIIWPYLFQVSFLRFIG